MPLENVKKEEKKSRVFDTRVSVSKEEGDQEKRRMQDVNIKDYLADKIHHPLHLPCES